MDLKEGIDGAEEAKWAMGLLSEIVGLKKLANHEMKKRKETEQELVDFDWRLTSCITLRLQHGQQIQYNELQEELKEAKERIGQSGQELGDARSEVKKMQEEREKLTVVAKEEKKLQEEW